MLRQTAQAKAPKMAIWRDDTFLFKTDDDQVRNNVGQIAADGPLPFEHNPRRTKDNFGHAKHRHAAFVQPVSEEMDGQLGPLYSVRANELIPFRFDESAYGFSDDIGGCDESATDDAIQECVKPLVCWI